MTDRYLEDFAVGQTFGSGRLRIDTEWIKIRRPGGQMALTEREA